MMFIAQTETDIIAETETLKWLDLPNGLREVRLYHPVLNISVGLNDCKRYAYIAEGIAVQGGIVVPRIAEILIGQLGNTYITIKLLSLGKIDVTCNNAEPEIDQSIWRNKEAN